MQEISSHVQENSCSCSRKTVQKILFCPESSRLWHTSFFITHEQGIPFRCHDVTHTCWPRVVMWLRFINHVKKSLECRRTHLSVQAQPRAIKIKQRQIIKKRKTCVGRAPNSPAPEFLQVSGIGSVVHVFVMIIKCPLIPPVICVNNFASVP